MPYRWVILMMAALLSCGPAGAAEPASRPVTVFAAASLTNVLDGLGREFTRTTGVPVRFSFASSSILARQIEGGAGADVFFPADQEWMDYLERRSRIQKSSRRNVVGKRLVLIAPRASEVQLVIEPGSGTSTSRTREMSRLTPATCSSTRRSMPKGWPSTRRGAAMKRTGIVG